MDSFDDLPVSSVVYIGRGSFRMEAVALEPELEPGTVQPIAGIVTAPLHATPANDLAEAAAAPHAVRALFSSQLSVPMLAAPTGSARFQAPAVTISRAMLATLAAVVLLCGVVVGTAARHLFASPAPLAVAPASPAVAAPVVAPAPSIVPVVEAQPAAALTLTPTLTKVRVHAPPAPRVLAPMRRAAPEPTQAKKAWVDPWAE